jgi:glutamate carboxypeptidase
VVRNDCADAGRTGTARTATESVWIYDFVDEHVNAVLRIKPLRLLLAPERRLLLPSLVPNTSPEHDRPSFYSHNQRACSRQTLLASSFPIRLMKDLIRPVLLAFLVQLVPGATPAENLNVEERKIVDYIDQHNGDATHLLARAVNVQSPTEDLAGVRAAGDLFHAEFQLIGLTTRWIDLPSETQRAGHLLAETHGRRGKRLLLLGHLDTVLRGEKFRVEGTRAYGTGIGDMKGGDVIALYALKSLHATGLLNDTRITVLLTGDEENPGQPVELSRGDMIAAARRCDVALSFESTVRNTATVGRRGASAWKLEVEARTGHSSQIFRDSMGYGAIYEIARILDQFRTTLSSEKYLTVSPGLIVGGTTAETTSATGSATGKINVVAAIATVQGDLRFISEGQQESARTKMREIVGRNLPGTKAKIIFTDGLPAMTPADGNYDLLKLLDQASHDLGLGTVEPLDPRDRGAGDIGYISHLLPSLDGIGISGGNAHAPGEFADLESLPNLTNRAALLIYRLTR